MFITVLELLWQLSVVWAF